jgi:hypothetical protein
MEGGATSADCDVIDPELTFVIAQVGYLIVRQASFLQALTEVLPIGLSCEWKKLK